MSKDTLNTLQDYHWPGNVRELESIIERAVITSQGTALQVLDRFENSQKAGEQEARDDGKALGEMEHDYILHVLQKTGWRIEGSSYLTVLLNTMPASDSLPFTSVTLSPFYLAQSSPYSRSIRSSPLAR
ncbi:MAG: hypothetical protein ABIJ25_10240 [Pseudomonadota bacterium]